MAARRKSKARPRKTNNILTKDLLIFIGIMAVVALVAYFMTYNAIASKINTEIQNNLGKLQLVR